jgi:N-acyl-D-aspartate/D-glutamate deacylase
MKIRVDLESEPGGWAEDVAWQRGDGIRIGSTPDHRFEGKTVSEIAKTQGIEPVEALFMVLEEERLKVSVILYSMEEGDVKRVLAYPWTMVGSDGLPPGLGGLPHPRLYGTFPRVIARYVRDLGLLSLEQAIHKMTGLAADTFGLKDRGVVREGAIADLVSFDAETIRDVATFDDPIRTPSGIHWVMQSGQVVVRGAHYVGHRQGQRLRRQELSS